MKQEDTVGSFKDQINILLNCAKSALKNEKGEEYHDQMLVPLTEAAVDIFIRGLPGNLSQLVDSIRPATLDAAYNEAVRLEARMDARIIPDVRVRGGYRGPNPETYTRDFRPNAYVGCIQDANVDEKGYWEESTEEFEAYESEWAGNPVEAEVEGYGMYYQQPLPVDYTTRVALPNSSNMLVPTKNHRQEASQGHPGYPGYPNQGNRGPRPGPRFQLQQRPRTYDPDKNNLTPRGQHNMNTRYVTPRTGPRMNGPFGHPPGQGPINSPQVPQGPHMGIPQGYENVNLRPTPSYGQPNPALNWQGARPKNGASHTMNSNTMPPTGGCQPAQTLQINVHPQPQSTLPKAKTLQALE